MTELDYLVTEIQGVVVSEDGNKVTWLYGHKAAKIRIKKLMIDIARDCFTLDEFEVFKQRVEEL